MAWEWGRVRIEVEGCVRVCVVVFFCGETVVVGGVEWRGAVAGVDHEVVGLGDDGRVGRGKGGVRC